MLRVMADPGKGFLDRTIALGNRLAEEFIPVNGHSLEEVASVALAASLFDDTPEGKSIVRLAQNLGAQVDFDRTSATGLDFSAKTRMSGTDLPDGTEVRKGAVDAVKGFVRSRGGNGGPDLDAAYERVSRVGRTPPNRTALTIAPPAGESTKYLSAWPPVSAKLSECWKKGTGSNLKALMW